MHTFRPPRTEVSRPVDDVPFGVPYVPHTSADVATMLRAIGVDTVDDLFRQIPEELRAGGRLDLPPPLPEPAVRSRLEGLARQNRTAGTACFAGGGFYSHWLPETVNSMLMRGEFATAYTPYQPEVSQGTLQAMFEFQSLIALLFSLDVANASLYDGASATAEAVLMAHRVLPTRRRILVSRAVHPHYRQAVRTYSQGLDLQVNEVPFGRDGRVDLSQVAGNVLRDAACVVLGYPNVFGVLEDISMVERAVRAAETLLVTTTAEPLSLGICQAPGRLGADVSVGEGQSLGLPLSYGGPGVGLFAVRERFLRHMPGRVVGATVDTQGRRGYVLTLATREQHIRRQRATSNICTNQTLCTIGIAVYLSLLGKHGFRRLAELNYHRAHKVANSLEAAGAGRRFGGPFFNEFVVQLPNATARWEKLADKGLLAGVPLGQWYPELSDCLLINITEAPSDGDIDRLISGLAT